MSLVLFLFAGLVTTQPISDSIWQHQKQQLTNAIESESWFSAKRALAFMKEQNPDRYEARGYDLTLARIYQREALRGSALGLYEQVTDHPLMALERMALLYDVGDDAAVIQLGNEKLLRDYGKGRTKRLLLLAQAHERRGEQEQADKIYRQLIRKAPRVVRQESYLKLATSAYAQGQSKKARQFAETLQKKWATSDEALQSVFLQLENEDESYRDQVTHLNRWARVCYNNRAFDYAEQFYKQVADRSRVRKVADGARYRLAMLPLKQGQPDQAVDAFSDILSVLDGGEFGDQASFQYARALLMSGRDQEAIEYCEEDWSRRRNKEWRDNHAKIHLQALRRQEDYAGFMAMEQRLTRGQASRSMMREYHRHAVIWSLQRDMPENALRHLTRFKKYGVPKRMRQEVLVWEGMIHQASFRYEEAVAVWLQVAQQDPNHFFGLIARELIEQNMLEVDINRVLKENKRHESLFAYYLQPHRRETLQAELQGRFKQPKILEAEEALGPDHPALNYLAIKRYDLAAAVLNKKDVPNSTYHYLKSIWYALDGDPHGSIRHAEVLADSFPDWVPYELLPQRVQELLFPRGFNQLIDREAERNKVDPNLLLAIIREESRFDTRAKSWASARGLMQFIPSTAKTIAAEVDLAEDFDLGQLYTPETAITLGARYVDKLMDYFDGKSLYTVAAYNAGEGAVHRWASFSKEYDPLFFIWDITYSETKFYCQKVLRAYHHYARVYEESPPDPLLTKLSPQQPLEQAIAR
jgi:soluble lytic murein transglycosylase